MLSWLVLDYSLETKALSAHDSPLSIVLLGDHAVLVSTHSSKANFLVSPGFVHLRPVDKYSDRPWSEVSSKNFLSTDFAYSTRLLTYHCSCTTFQTRLKTANRLLRKLCKMDADRDMYRWLAVLSPERRTKYLNVINEALDQEIEARNRHPTLRLLAGPLVRGSIDRKVELIRRHRDLEFSMLRIDQTNENLEKSKQQRQRLSQLVFDKVVPEVPRRPASVVYNTHDSFVVNQVGPGGMTINGGQHIDFSDDFGTGFTITSGTVIGNKKAECAICLGSLSQGSSVCFSQCGHWFHTGKNGCITSHATTCPLCKKQ